MKNGSAHPPQLFFEDRESWRDWLEANHGTEREVWLVFYKKHTGTPCMSYDEAVEEAICFGWIDSILKRLDDARYVRKFTPRVDTRKWSALNLKRAEKLKASGRMTKAGLAKIAEDARPSAPAPAGPPEVPPFFEEALAKNKAAREFFDELAPSYRRHFVGWVSSAKKEETRRRRLKEAISLLERRRKLGLK
jgi:uncharacterized protein YdeI (YjbR/CyaY-like superfamily)